MASVASARWTWWLVLLQQGGCGGWFFCSKVDVVVGVAAARGMWWLVLASGLDSVGWYCPMWMVPVDPTTPHWYQIVWLRPVLW